MYFIFFCSRGDMQHKAQSGDKLMCHVKVTGKCVVWFGVCVRHVFIPSKFTATDQNCVLMAYGESSVFKKWRREFESSRTHILGDNSTGYERSTSGGSDLENRRVTIRDCQSEVEMALREWLRKQEPDLYRNGIFKLMSRWDKCIMIENVTWNKWMTCMGRWNDSSLNFYVNWSLTYGTPCTRKLGDSLLTVS